MQRLKLVRKAACASAVAVIALAGMFGCAGKAEAANPYLPEWEHIPDGEPYVFEDPQNPGKERVYIYGSHDTRKTDYCGYDITVWSAPVEDLTDWRCDGIVFEYSPDGTKEKRDILYAPDVAVVNEADGTKTYYLYPNDQGSGRGNLIAKSKSPIGPFVACNLKEGSTTEATGVMGFDPAVFVDDDGRVYGYWGFGGSRMAELDPKTMCTVKEGTSIIEDAISNVVDDESDFRFYEASSIRKIQGKYVFIYSRKTWEGEFGLGPSTGTLAYAYSDSPLGPWTYGGTVVDARARNEDESGKVFGAMAATNTHGSLVEINGQWYIFYHRSINNDGGHSRQGMADPVDIEVTPDGKVVISEAEVTSQGMEINGLNPYEEHSAGISCYMSGGSYILATYDQNAIGGAVANNVNGSVVGYKYINFTDAAKYESNALEIGYTGNGTEGTITVMMDSPYELKGGKELGSIQVAATDSTTEETKKTLELNTEDLGTGKHALYFLFQSSDTEKSICNLNRFVFQHGEEIPVPTATAVPTTAPADPTSPAGSASPAGSTAAPVASPAVTASPVPAATDEPGGSKGLVKGKLYTKGSLRYKFLGNGRVSVAGVKSKAVRKVTVPKTVKINGVVCKVTEIGKQAFSGCSKLKKISVSSTQIKKVGKNAFKGIHKKAVIRLPKKCQKKYKKMFLGKGQKSSVKVKL